MPLKNGKTKLELCDNTKGCAKHTSSLLKKEKQQLTTMINELHKRAENNPLTPNEIVFKHYLNKRLAHMLREEELK